MTEAYQVWYKSEGDSASIEGRARNLSVTPADLERAKEIIRKRFTRRRGHEGKERYSKGNVLLEIDEREPARLRYGLKVFAHSEDELVRLVEEELELPYRDLEGTTLVGAKIPDSVRKVFETINRKA